MQPWKPAPPPAGFTPDLEMPTLLVPCDCTCAFVVVRSGPGLAAVSRRKYANNSCPARHRPVAAVPAAFSGSQ